MSSHESPDAKTRNLFPNLEITLKKVENETCLNAKFEWVFRD